MTKASSRHVSRTLYSVPNSDYGGMLNAWVSSWFRQRATDCSQQATDCSLGASKQARLHRVTRNAPRKIIATKPDGSYSPRRQWCIQSPSWEPGSEGCVQIFGDDRSIAAIPFAS